VPDIALIVSSLKLSILCNELHYSQNFPKYSLFPLACGIALAVESIGHVG
jgi:hypothetical protein